MAESTNQPPFDVADAVLGNIVATTALYALLIKRRVITVKEAQGTVREAIAGLDETEQKGAAAFLRAHFRVLLQG